MFLCDDQDVETKGVRIAETLYLACATSFSKNDGRVEPVRLAPLHFRTTCLDRHHIQTMCTGHVTALGWSSRGTPARANTKRIESNGCANRMRLYFVTSATTQQVDNCSLAN